MGQRRSSWCRRHAPDPDPGRAAEHGERDRARGAGQPEPALHPALLGHPPRALQPGLPPHARRRLQPAAGQADRGRLGGGGPRRQPRLHQVPGRCDAKKTTVSARLQVYVRTAQRAGAQDAHGARRATTCAQITGLDAYEGYVVEELDAGCGEVALRQRRR